MSEALLPGLRYALKLCREVDRKQRKDGLLREPVDCAERIEGEIRSIQFAHLIKHNVSETD